MFGVFLITFATLVSESADSFGKFEVSKKEEGLYSMGFINMFVATLFLCFGLFFGQKFFVSMASLPTLLPRIALEIIQTHVTLLAIIKADRSTYSFIRTITIPLLLLVDVFLGYKLMPTQMLGVFIIILAIFLAGYEKVMSRNGMWFVLLTGINAVITISLYKYNITHFNSVLGEQITVQLAILLYLSFLIYFKKEQSLRSLMKMKFLLQSSAGAVGGLMETFAYAYAPASVILSGKRAVGMLWSTLAGWKFFGEKNLLEKLIVCTFLVIGVVLLI